MNERSKIILALMQIDNITSLVEGNEYQQYLYGHLIQLQVELKRQLTNLNCSDKVKRILK